MDNKTITEPYYDEHDAVQFIASDTGISKRIIRNVLNAEMKYMKSVGIIDCDVDEYINEMNSDPEFDD